MQRAGLVTQRYFPKQGVPGDARGVESYFLLPRPRAGAARCVIS